jgi:uncharacterized membrane protein (DUF4010 family)
VDLASALNLIVATLGGAAIGLEREWSGHASGPHAHFGGFRTFTLLGGLGGGVGWLAVNGFAALGVVLLAAAAGLVVAGYAAASRHDIDATTEVAAIVVLAAGMASGAGNLVLGSGAIAATAVLLLEKTRLHAFAHRLEDKALRASVRFAAMACVILPLLPTGPYGPYDAIRPRELWALVLFFSGLTFLGWLARRAVGPKQGAIVAGLIGGIISSTSVTLTFARESREDDAPRLALAAGAVGACTLMLVRVMVASAVLNPALAWQLPRYISVAFLIGAATVFAVWRSTRPSGTQKPEDGSPLRVRAALQMTAMFQVVLFAIIAVQTRWGSEALVATSAFVGLTDLDALTLSLSRSASSPDDIPSAAIALVAGILSNTALKLTVAAVVGRGAFRVVTSSVLGAMALAVIAVLIAD